LVIVWLTKYEDVSNIVPSTIKANQIKKLISRVLLYETNATGVHSLDNVYA